MAHATRETHLRTLEEEAAAHHVNPRVLDAIIHVESSWSPLAVRYERQYAYLVTPDRFAASSRITLETEVTLQRMSFGLCQIMGGTARDLGYTGPLTMLFDPEVNIGLGVQLFARLAGDYLRPDDQIAAYNAGSVRRRADGRYVNQDYVDKVRGVLATL